jgi:quercetin dioxygenase-like cupin family protein
MEQQTLHRTIGRGLDQSLAVFEVDKALSDLKAEEALAREGRNAIILHKEELLKVVLVAMRSGNLIRSHKAAVPITVQVLEGAIRFDTDAGSKRLERGGILTLHAGIAHSVTALEDAAFLLTLAGPHGH